MLEILVNSSGFSIVVEIFIIAIAILLLIGLVVFFLQILWALCGIILGAAIGYFMELDPLNIIILALAGGVVVHLISSKAPPVLKERLVLMMTAVSLTTPSDILHPNQPLTLPMVSQ